MININDLNKKLQENQSNSIRNINDIELEGGNFEF